jgi:murein DD-endopeptidase MepM/ murein hydrolase activator NlpD
VDLLARRKVSPNTSLAVAKAAKPVFDLARQLQPGKILRMAFAEDGKLLGLSYPMDTDRDFWITRNTLVVKEEDTTSFVPQIQTKTMEVKTKTISGVIKSSLFEDGRKAGISQSMVVRMASLLEYDVDFARDIQTGDRFTVVFEEKYHQGKAVRDGEILAVEFINQGKAHQVFRYTDATGTVGYFGRDGTNIKKMFIRAPVDFVRITSTFSTSRMHPILGYSRAHKGVDYGAPTGTPVRAAADGKIVAMGFDSGYGNKVMIKHNNKYSTAYAHLSRFNSAFKVGSSVRQGQTIGLVGTTGMSTGPHLHYEILVNNEQVNPLSVQMASSEGIQKKYMNDFQKSITSMMAKLGSSGENAVASAQPVSKKGRTAHR